MSFGGLTRSGLVLFVGAFGVVRVLGPWEAGGFQCP